MICAILLAAGQSKRMGNQNKLIKKIKGVPLIEITLNNILESSVEEIIVVTGHQKQIIKKIIKKNKKIKFVFNKHFKSGMSSSIKKGLLNMSKKTEYFFICLGDMPKINRKIYDKIIHHRSNHDIIVPMYKGKRGHPVLFNKKMKEKIMTIKGDSGAKKILDYHKKNSLKIKINNKNILKDLDTEMSFI